MLELYCLTGEFPEKDNMRTINSFQDDFKNKIENEIFEI